jgi:group II intron reverse transcriptase/maturase
VHLNVGFSTESELKAFLDFLYAKSGQSISFTGLLEAMCHEVTIVTAVHNIKSNKGSKTAGVDEIKMDSYLQMPKQELIDLIQRKFHKYQPKPARRVYIPKSNGKQRPLGIPSAIDRVVQECMRIVLEPICEAQFYPHSYGFRPYRAQKHAIRDIVNVINAGCRSPDQPVWAVEGDIKGCFDNINHRLLLQKLWRMGIHDKRVLSIIKAMLKAGYIESGIYYATTIGSPQGSILSPLLSNVYLNDFDWYIGRSYMEPHRQCKHKCNDTRRLKWSGITPKYNYRFADDWVILTSTQAEALRLKRQLTKYFRYRMKLDLSQEKTYVTDLRTDGIHFLGFVVKAERKRKTPDPATWSETLVGKPFPDMNRLTKKICNLSKEVRRIGLFTQPNTQAAQIQYVNSIIMGLAQYLQPSICSAAYHAIDRRVNNTALAVWKNLFPKRYNQMQVPLQTLCNLPHRHEGYKSKTFAIEIEGKWFGITCAFITHAKYETRPFNQHMTPYTEEGRRIYVSYRTKHKPLPCDRPSINTPEDILLSAYARGKGWKANFEYFMNREYAYNRDKGKCKCCGRYFSDNLPKHCHHVNNKLPVEKINKVSNLAWLCVPCHRMVHNSPIYPGTDQKTIRKIEQYKQNLT